MTTAALVAAAVLSVPFVPQQKDTCAAASLAMVLHYWEAHISHDEIAAALRDAQLHGILGSRLEAFTRERGFTAIAYAGDLPSLRDHVAKGRPLIVAWRVGGDKYHDVVVLGYDDGSREIVVNDPAVGASRRIAARTFEKRWAAAGYWTLLVVPSGR